MPDDPTQLEREAARAVAGSRGVDADRIRLTPQLNWGGFENRSFVATDGDRRWFLKLAGSAEAIEKLRRWQAVAPLLAARYAAPAMLDWIVAPGTPYQGALFDFVDGVMPSARTSSLVGAVVPMMQRLHADAELVARLETGALPRRCSDVYLATYSDRFRGDIATVAESPPSFVSDATLRYLRAEVGTLELLVLSSSSFDVRARAAMHGDLWLDNILVRPNGTPSILDWDDLAIGDPALDWAMFFGPSASALTTVDPDKLPPSAAADRHLVERLVILARASLLDWVIDPLADYVDADALPEFAPRVKEEKERLHREALARYRDRYR
ncbi:MAG: aminoglycoside phosphotransferase family protein [Gemmatimonadaceae bacterium]